MSTQEPIEETLWLTPEGYKALEEELQHLTTVRRHEIAERIRESKEHGEFAEDNTELEDAKKEQAYVESRILEIKAILGSAEVLTPSDIPTRKVGIGSLVTLRNRRNKAEFTILVVSSAEADPEHDKISSSSPLGAALMGAHKGDIVKVHAPGGTMSYEVLKIGKGVRKQK